MTSSSTQRIADIAFVDIALAGVALEAEIALVGIALVGIALEANIAFAGMTPEVDISLEFNLMLGAKRVRDIMEKWVKSNQSWKGRSGELI
jgi:hypothetical protein